jgi:hypothetical protein
MQGVYGTSVCCARPYPASVQSDRDESHMASHAAASVWQIELHMGGVDLAGEDAASLANCVLLHVVEYSQQQPLPHARGVVSFQIWSVPCRSTYSSRLGWARARCEVTTMIQEGTGFSLLVARMRSSCLLSR